MAVGIQAGMALSQLLDANHVQRHKLERTRAHFLTLQLARVVSNSACLQAIIAVSNVLTSMVKRHLFATAVPYSHVYEPRYWILSM